MRPAGEPSHFVAWGGLSDAEGNRAVLCFLVPLLSLFHYFSKMDHSYHCYLVIPGRRFLHGLACRNTGKALGRGVVDSPCQGAFASISESCVFLGERHDTINGLLWFLVWRRDTFWGCTGNAQEVKGVQGGRARVARPCGVKPARRKCNIRYVHLKKMPGPDRYE